MESGRIFDENEITSDFNINDLDELPPIPAGLPSNRSFDVLGSLANINQQDAFRALYGYRTQADASLQISVASQRSDEGMALSAAAQSLYGAPLSSESLVIEIEASTSQDHAADGSRSRMSLGSEESVEAPPGEEEERESAEAVGSVIWRSRTPLLKLRNASLRHGERTLFENLNLDISRTGIHIIVCDERFCRRLLLAMLAGTTKSPTLRLEGTAVWTTPRLDQKPQAQLISLSASDLLLPLQEYLPRDIGNDDSTHIEQILKEHFLGSLSQRMNCHLHEMETHERRAVALLRASLGSSQLLMLDDPLDELGEEATTLILNVLRKLATTQAILIVATEPGQLSMLDPQTAWHHEGSILPHPEQHEGMEPSANFSSLTDGHSFAHERIADSRNPDHSPPPSATKEESQAELLRPTTNGHQGPRGFNWLVAGCLAGTPEPGILFDIDYDLSLLRAAGITLLVTLTEHPLPEDLIEAHGLRSLFFPIVDMNVPSCRATEALCELVAIALDQGEVIAFHCKAGLGRTGTLLVSYLIWEGAPPAEALAIARSIEPGWVQSTIQEEYLVQFAEYCRSRRPQTAQA